MVNFNLFGVGLSVGTQGERMSELKITCWNIQHMSRLFANNDTKTMKRRRNVAQQIRDINADILCILEGTPDPGDVADFCANDLGGDWSLVTASDGYYGTSGTQFIWFLVKNHLRQDASLLPVSTFKEFAGGSWDVFYDADLAGK